MFHPRVLVALILLALPFVEPLPTGQDPADVPHAARSSVEPGTLLGRRYSLQPRGGPFYIVQDTEVPPSEAQASHNHTQPKRHASPFPKYLAEHQLHTRSMAHEQADVSDVGAAKRADLAYAEAYPSVPAQPSPPGAHLVTRTAAATSHPTSSTDVKQAKAKAKHAKTAEKKTREMESLD